MVRKKWLDIDKEKYELKFTGVLDDKGNLTICFEHITLLIL